MHYYTSYDFQVLTFNNQLQCWCTQPAPASATKFWEIPNPDEIDIRDKSTSVLPEYLATDDLHASNDIPKANEKHVPRYTTSTHVPGLRPACDHPC